MVRSKYSHPFERSAGAISDTTSAPGPSVFDNPPDLCPGTSLRSRESLQLDFEVHFKPSGFPNRRTDTLDIANSIFLTSDAWLPAIGYQADRELRNVGDPRKYSLAVHPETLEGRADRFGNSLGNHHPHVVTLVHHTRRRLCASCIIRSYMRRDSRLSVILHVLLHLAEHSPMTSEALAACTQTNPVVIRRTMAALRRNRLVVSEKGHGGGWTLACDLKKVTLRDIYAALGEPVLFAIGNRTERPRCLVEQVVNSALSDAFQEAEAMLAERLATVSLAQLAADFHRRLARYKNMHRRLSDEL